MTGNDWIKAATKKDKNVDGAFATGADPTKTTMATGRKEPLATGWLEQAQAGGKIPGVDLQEKKQSSKSGGSSWIEEAQKGGLPIKKL